MFTGILLTSSLPAHGQRYASCSVLLMFTTCKPPESPTQPKHVPSSWCPSAGQRRISESTLVLFSVPREWFGVTWRVLRRVQIPATGREMPPFVDYSARPDLCNAGCSCNNKSLPGSRSGPGATRRSSGSPPTHGQGLQCGVTRKKRRSTDGYPDA